MRARLPTRSLSVAAISVAALGLTGPIAQAGEGAHIHGEAQLAVSIEATGVSVALTSAMYNIVGFERPPETVAETARFTSALQTLESGDTLFVFNPEAACSLQTLSHNLIAPGAAPSAETPTNTVSSSFRDLEATYAFACETPEALAQLSVSLFAAFERLEAVKAVVFTETQQSAATLTPTKVTLRLVD